MGLNRITSLHSKGFIHRDVKPANLMLGIGEKSKLVHLVDFGLSRKYYDP
jgi:serine/threonine protein kinase